jgi:DNA-binding response OmpR family regulator
MLKSTLEKNGYEVITAPDGDQALRLIKTNVPDLMIVDLTMPVMNGWSFNMRARADARFKNTPIIILSGLLEDVVSSEKMEDGITYVAKPFDIFNLMDKVNELLR